MPVYELSEDQIELPYPEDAEDDGMLAIGGDLSPERLMLGYRHGIFPWYGKGNPIIWWSPPERYIIRPEKIHISHSMKKFLRKHDTKIEINGDFQKTMHRCREKREAEGTWINDDMEEAYYRLHKLGYAISVEAYIDGERAGGLYGVISGKVFCGESMYTDIENGSKVALIHLAGMLEKAGFIAIDCQFHTDHLESMGGESLSRSEYLKLLEDDEFHLFTDRAPVT